MCDKLVLICDRLLSHPPKALILTSVIVFYICIVHFIWNIHRMLNLCLANLNKYQINTLFIFAVLKSDDY